MSEDIDSIIEDRLSVFNDEPDLNDWVEVMCGAAMAVIGIFHLVQPGELVDPDIMRWFAAAVVAAGAVWTGHGLKDMAVKEVRRSIAILEMSGQDSVEGPNHGLIRDVLSNPKEYKSFLIESYNSAWEDGIITEEELKELKDFQSALGISDEEAAEMNVEAAIKSAAEDGEISEDEESMIKKIAGDAEMDVQSKVEKAKDKAKSKSKSKSQGSSKKK
jgi:tellurite resistance protein